MATESDGLPWAQRAPRKGERAALSRLVEARYIELFTAISGDENPLHYDPSAAERAGFGGVIVQGGVTTSLLNALVAGGLPGPGSVFLQLDLAFKSPVHPGETITASAEVAEVRLDKPITTLAVEITNESGEVVVEGRAVCYTFDLAREQRE